MSRASREPADEIDEELFLRSRPGELFFSLLLAINFGQTSTSFVRFRGTDLPLASARHPPQYNQPFLRPFPAKLGTVHSGF